MNKKQELKEKIKELGKKEKEIKKEIKETEEYKKLSKEEKELRRKKDKLDDEIEEIEEDTTFIYLDSKEEPKYHKSYDTYGYGYERNIKKEVLNSIKRGLGITNLSLLRGSEIEKIVRKLIDTKLKNNKEYSKKVEEVGRIKERLYGVEEEKDKLIEITDKIWNERQSFYRELDKIEDREQRTKDLKNPEKRKKLKQYQKQYKKGQEARAKLKNVDEKLGKIQTELTKELIINNLREDEKD